MEKIKIIFEYHCFPIWRYDGNDNLIENDLPSNLVGDIIIDPLFVSLQDEFDSLFKDDGINFEYIGFEQEDFKNQFICRVDEAIKLLRVKVGDNYVIENCLDAKKL